MQSQWIYEFILAAHAPPGGPQGIPPKVAGRIGIEREGDPVEMENDSRSYVGFRQPPLTKNKSPCGEEFPSL